MTVVAKARSSPMATSRRRAAVGRFSMGAVLTSWLLDALGLSAGLAWRARVQGGQVARCCGGEVGLGLAGVGDADRRVGVRAPVHGRGLLGPRPGGGSWCGCHRGGAWLRRRRSAGLGSAR